MALRRFVLMGSLLVGALACRSPENMAVEPVSATIGPEGGALALALPTGDELALDIPEGALRQPVSITLGAGELDGDAFPWHIAPAGLVPTTPIGLTLTLADDPGAVGLAWIDGEGEVPIAATQTGVTIVADLVGFGYGLGPGNPASTSARGPVRGAASLTVTPASCDQLFEAKLELLRASAPSGDPEAFRRAAETTLALMSRCDDDRGEALQQAACDQLDAVGTNARAIAVDDFDTYRATVGALIQAKAEVSIADAECDDGIADVILEEKFAQYLVFLESELARASVGADPEVHLDHLTELLRLAGVCSVLALSDTVCASFEDALIPNALDRYRAAAWGTCRATGNASDLGQLVAFGAATAPTTSPTDPFLGYARFSRGAIESDALRCALALDIRTFEDAEGVPVEVQRATPAPGSTPDQQPPRVDLALPLDGSLTIAGDVSVPSCPPSGAPDAQLVIRVGGVEVDRHSASGTRFTLGTRPLDLPVAQVIAAAGLPATGGNAVVDLVVEPVDCPYYLSPVAVYAFDVRVGDGEPGEPLQQGMRLVGTVTRTDQQLSCALSGAPVPCTGPADQVDASVSSSTLEVDVILAAGGQLDVQSISGSHEQGVSSCTQNQFVSAGQVITTTGSFDGLGPASAWTGTTLTLTATGSGTRLFQLISNCNAPTVDSETSSPTTFEVDLGVGAAAPGGSVTFSASDPATGSTITGSLTPAP